MPVDWYLMRMTGSLHRSNTYVRRFTKESERSGVLTVSPKIPALSSLTSIPKRSKRSRKKKSLRTSKVAKIGPQETKSATKTKPAVVQDSPQMLEFFAEVRQRELRDYYRRMKAAERSRTTDRICHNCRRPRGASKDPSVNIYCSGAQSMRQDLKNRSWNKDWDRYRDLTWLCSSSIAHPHSALSCG